MHRGIKTKLAATFLVVGLVALAACVRRTETIRVEPDGTIHLAVEFDGDEADVRGGDAMLADAGRWVVSDEFRVEDDKPKLRRTATLTVQPGEPVPADYAGGDADLASLALQMSTSVDIDERPDGTYYHFRRTYHQREWAHVDYFRRQLVEEHVKQLEDKKFEEMSDQDRRTVAKAFVDFEMVKSLVLAEEAAEEMDPPVPQAQWLAIHRGIRDIYQNMDLSEVVQILGMDHEESAKASEAKAEQVTAAVEQVMGDVLRQYDPSGRKAQAYMEHLVVERQRFAISEDLQDDSFEVKVRLPGTLVVHNSFDDVSEEGEVVWRIDGPALNDRDEVLMATSVVERK